MKIKATFSSFSTSDEAKARDFYVNTLGLELDNDEMGLDLLLPGGARVFVYEKTDHQPATHTVLNFVVEDIEAAVEELKGKGIEFEEIDFGGGAKTDEKGIMRGKAANQGPDIAWFKDPAGNTLAVLED